MKKCSYAVIGAILAISMFCFFEKAGTVDKVLDANVEALSRIEDPIEFPCERATSRCSFPAKIGDEIVLATVAGLRNIDEEF